MKKDIICFPTSFGRVCWDKNEKLDKRSIATRIKDANKARLERTARWLYENSDLNWASVMLMPKEEMTWEKLHQGRRVKGKLSPSPNRLYYREKAQKLLQVIDNG